MTVSTHPAPGTTLDLGIGNISPCGAGWLELGRVYALNTSCPTIRFPLLGSLIGNAIDSGVPCSLVLRSRAAEYLEQLNTPPKIDLAQAFSHRALNVYLMQDDFQKKLFQSGPRRMLEEISKFGVAEDSLVVFEHATDLLNLHDMALARSQLDAIADWSRERRVATLIVFANTQEQRVISPRALLDSMSGLAEFDDDREGLALSFPYWRSGGQVATGERFLLRLNSDGRYVPAASVAVPATRGAEPAIQHLLKSLADSPRPYTTAPALHRKASVGAVTGAPLGAGLRDFEGRKELTNSRLLRSSTAARASRRVAS